MVEREVCLDSSLYVLALEAYRHELLALTAVFRTPQRPEDAPLADLLLDRNPS